MLISGYENILMRIIVGGGVVTWLIGVAVSLLSCHSYKSQPKTIPGISGQEKLLLFAFKDVSQVYGTQANVRCAICGNMYITGKVEKGAARLLTGQLRAIINKNTSFKLIPPAIATAAESKFVADGMKSVEQKDLYILIGRELNAELIMIGHLYRYQDRVGNRFAVDVPASVAFDVHLIRVEDGRLLWTGSVDQKQRPLSEDLLSINMFFKRKGGWVTASEMAADELERMMDANF